MQARLAQLWKDFFDASPDPQLVCSCDGTVECVNPRALSLLKALLVEGQKEFRLYDALRSPANQALRSILESRPLAANTLDSVTLVAGENRLTLDLELTPLDADHALIALKDCGRHLRLESHVRRLITAIDSTPEVFFITDAELRLTFVNPAFQITTGYNIEEVLGRSDAFLRAATEQDKVRAYLESVRHGREWIGELINVRRDGTVYHAEATLSPISDGAGRFVGYVACERDITPRLRLQNELRLERDLIQSVLASLDGAIYTLDREFRLTHANEGWRRLPPEHGGLRFDGPPAVGQPLLDHVPDPNRRDELKRAFEEVLRSRQAREDRYHSTDSRCWLVRISPWIHADEVRGLICTITDQTHYQELQNQLFQSQKMEIIGTLAAGIAHDFNNLIHAIRGNTSLIILQTPETSDLHHWAEQINVAADRAADITQQLLSFSREAEEQRAVLDLNDVLLEAGHLARRTLRANINLELVPYADPVPVKVDSTRATQALLNLCVNAQDAMPNGGRLTITNTIFKLTDEQAKQNSLEAARDYACCSVTDTGSGIPEDLLPHIFEPFFTTKEKGKGTGLGLAIVQRVMHEAGGFLKVDSVAGVGTTFHLYFPLVEGEPDAAPEQARSRLARGSGRVLVVDDLDLLRDFTKSFLEAVGLDVLVAADGKEALKILEEKGDAVDLLFTDYSMPEMTGIELIERVTPRWPKIQLVLASGYLDEAAHKKLATLKVNVLVKPYEMQDAAELLVRLLPKKD